jgi:hypothetical protein
MVGLPCLVSQCAKLHIAGWTWAVFTHVNLELCTWPVAIFTMDQSKEQWVCIIFCANLGKSATETLTIIQQAFGDQILSCTQVFQWHAWFKTGRTSVDNDKHTETHKLHNSWNCCMNSRARSSRSTSDHLWCCWGGENWLCDMPMGSDERVGHAPYCNFTIRMSHLTLLSSSSSFWRNTKWLSPPTHHTPLIWHPVTSSYFQKWNWSWKEASLIQLRKSGWIAESVWHSDRKGLPGSVPKMEEVVGLVSTCRRELLWGWWRPIGLMVNLWFLQHQSRIVWIPPP